jgi:hypothetical protein
MSKARIGLTLGLGVLATFLTTNAGQDKGANIHFISFHDGQSLHDKCRHQDQDFFPEGSSVQDNLNIQNDTGYCIGYITGLAESLDLKWWSPPVPLNQRQVVAVVKKYIDGHPEVWNQSALVSVRNALIESFPPKRD